jgi:hypothetical protein
MNKLVVGSYSLLVSRLTALVAPRIPQKSALDIGWKFAYIRTSVADSSEKGENHGYQETRQAHKEARKSKGSRSHKTAGHDIF